MNLDNNYKGIVYGSILKTKTPPVVGELLRVKKINSKNNNIHFERITIHEKIRLITINKRKRREDGESYSKYIGSEHFYLPLEQARELILKAFGYKEFTSRQLTYWVFWSEDFGIQDKMDSKGVGEFAKRYSTWDFCKKLHGKGFLDKREEIINSVPDTLGRIKKKIWYKLRQKRKHL